jgi:DNA polymerase I-like protein with 3'-5' exonuclease and polymerase domains
MGKWLPFNPSPDSIKDSEYGNEELNNMMKSYIENQEKAKLFHEHRKNELVRKNILDNLNTRRDNLKDLKKELKNNKSAEEKIIIESNIKSAEDQIKIMDSKKKELDTQIENLDNQLKLFKPAIPTVPKIIETNT